MPTLQDLHLTQPAHRNRAVVARVAVGAGTAAALLAVVLLATGFWWLAAPFVLTVIGFAVWAWSTIDTRALRTLAARPVGDAESPRLHNVLHELCLAAGAVEPATFVVDDPSTNIASIARDPSSASIVVTTALLEALSPVELEAVLAHELVRIHRLDCLPVLVGRWFPPALHWGAEVTPIETDLAAVTLTRYPPGLLSAYTKISGRVTPVTAKPWTRQLWAFTDDDELREARLAVLREI